VNSRFSFTQVSACAGNCDASSRDASNNLADVGLKKGLDHLAQVREKLLAVTDQTANSKLPSTKPTIPSKTSSNCSKPLEFVEVFLFTNETVRI
jgi:hypothetical protein